MIPYKYKQLTRQISYGETIQKYKTKLREPHLGQLKLFFTELFFLSKHAKPGNKVLYIGAANGYHINKLVELFPELMFDLWDPGKFEIKESKNVKINNKYFTDDYARKYVHERQNILFISDIRTIKIGQYTKEGNIEKIDELVMDDMEMQANWVKIIRPGNAYLKFRLPYHGHKFKYLKGTIYLQPYSPLSTEARLMTNDYDSYKEYDATEYDEKFAYFNYITRQTYRTDKWDTCLNKYHIYNFWDNILALYITKFYIYKKYNTKSNSKACKLFIEIVAFHQERLKNVGKYVFEKIIQSNDPTIS